MKKSIMLISFMLLTSSAWAGGSYHSSIKNSFNTSNTYVVESSDPNDFAWGVGADVTVLKTSNPLFDSVSVDYRHDFENDSDSVFAVAHVDLFKAITGK